MPKERYTLSRWLVYAAGLLLLALGLTLNVKTGLGTAPVLSIAFAISGITGLNFSMIVFGEYLICLLLQYLLLREKAGKLLLLQFPFSIVFSSLLNLFGKLLPLFPQNPVQQFLQLAVAMTLTGIGVALSVAMRIVPNPADGLAQAIGIVSGKGTGFGKNVADICCVSITLTILLACRSKVKAIGIGTLLTMICVGRVIAVFNHFFKARLDRIRTGE